MTPAERKRLKAEEELFAELCDVIERAWQRWPVDSYKDDPHYHTSDYARQGARRIMDYLEKVRPAD